MQNAGTTVLKNLLAAGLSVLEFPAPFDGTITRIDITARAANANGDTIFDVNVNDATIFADQTQRPKLLQNQVTGAKSGLNVAVTRGQWITVDADIVPPGGFAGKLSIAVTIEDAFVIGAANGVAGLDGGGKVPIGQLPHGTASGIADLDAGAKVPVAQLPVNAANGVAGLDGGGLINASQLPALAITDVFTTSSQAAMLALAAQTGDVAIRTDTGNAYILATNDPTTLANWKLLPQATQAAPIGSAGGDLAGNYPNPTLAILAGLVAGATGSKTAVPVVTINTKGLITAISTASIVPGGDLGGADITGAVVNGLKGRSIGGIPAVAGFVSDNFNDNAISSYWAHSGNSAEQNTRYELALQSGGIQSYLRGAAGENWTGHYAQVKIVDLVAGSGLSDGYLIRWYNDSSGNAISWYVDTGGVRPAFFNGSGPTFLSVVSMVGVTHLRLREASGTIYWEYSTDGGSTWTAAATRNLSAQIGISITALKIDFWFEGSGGTNHYYFDDFLTDIPAADPITGMNYFGILWDNPNGRFSLLKSLGMVAQTVGAPAGAPANVPAGYTELRYDMTAHILYAWNGATWDLQAF